MSLFGGPLSTRQACINYELLERVAYQQQEEAARLEAKKQQALLRQQRAAGKQKSLSPVPSKPPDKKEKIKADLYAFDDLNDDGSKPKNEAARLKSVSSQQSNKSEQSTHTASKLDSANRPVKRKAGVPLKIGPPSKESSPVPSSKLAGPKGSSSLSNGSTIARNSSPHNHLRTGQQSAVVSSRGANNGAPTSQRVLAPPPPPHNRQNGPSRAPSAAMSTLSAKYPGLMGKAGATNGMAHNGMLQQRGITGAAAMQQSRLQQASRPGVQRPTMNGPQRVRPNRLIDEDDEYEDDFVVDDDEEEEWRKELKSITGYNPNKYRDVDQDDRDMVANWRAIEAEEKRSLRLARAEDEQEEEAERKRLQAKAAKRARIH